MSSDADPKNPFQQGTFRDADNPYQTPGAVGTPFGTPYGPRRGLTGHIRIAAILSGAQAMLELLMAAMFLFLAVMMKYDLQRNPPPGAPDPDLFLAIFGGIGGAVAAVALFRIFGAYCMFVLRRRIWAIASALVGLFTVFTFYCSVTSVGVAVYMLVVLFNSEVIDAFSHVAGGKSPRETLDEYRNLPA